MSIVGSHLLDDSHSGVDEYRVGVTLNWTRQPTTVRIYTAPETRREEESTREELKVVDPYALNSNRGSNAIQNGAS